tara:strand:+ start:926 stop:1378 length:453 start_codon:yes stop_codon:yes gene_type:complete
MAKITNIDTLSALLDRLISENIKLYFFDKEGILDDINHQKEVISQIKDRIKELLLDVYDNKKYDYISEKRTYTADLTIEAVEQLIKSDIYTGEGDRTNLAELEKKNPDVNSFRKNHRILRSANELRAVSKNEVDKQFKNLVEDENIDSQP